MGLVFRRGAAIQYENQSSFDKSVDPFIGPALPFLQRAKMVDVDSVISSMG